MINTDFFSIWTCNSGEFKVSLSPEVTVKVLLSEGSFGAAAELHLLHLRRRWDSYTVIHLAHSACVSTTDWCSAEREGRGQSILFWGLKAHMMCIRAMKFGPVVCLNSQAAPGGCAGSILGDFLERTGQCPERFGLILELTLLWAGGWTRNLPRSLPT